MKRSLRFNRGLGSMNLEQLVAPHDSGRVSSGFSHGNNND